MYYFSEYNSPIGVLSIAGDKLNIVGLWIRGQRFFLDTLSETPARNDALPVLRLAKKWLDAYFSGEKPSISDIPLAPVGNEFRQTVWKILTEIPYGCTTTYGDIAKETAKRLGKTKMSAQAVGGAVGHNPISIIIPCHRVIGADGSLTGYAGGLDKKIKLLRHEGLKIKNGVR